MKLNAMREKLVLRDDLGLQCVLVQAYLEGKRFQRLSMDLEGRKQG